MAATSNHPPAPAGRDSDNAEKHQIAQTQTQQQVIQSPDTLPDHWKSGLRIKDRVAERSNDYTKEQIRAAWEKENEAVKLYRDETIQRWVEEMENLLVFAGLYSGILTAFNVESYLLLSPAAPDPVLAALTQISDQLASFSVHNPFINSTQPTFRSSFNTFNSTSVQTWAVWLNALWFSSLICSLSAALFAIMVKQWLHAYNSEISGTALQTTRHRQHRYNGLVKWKVAEIIAFLPVLLQFAFALFLAGLLLLLWKLNRTVAIVASTLVGVLLVFTLLTIFLPTFYSTCAYLSPPSIFVYRVLRTIFTPIRSWICTTAYSVWLVTSNETTIWLIARWFVYAFQKPLEASVYARELAYVTKNPRKLDQDGFLTAYHTTGDLGLLNYTSTCFSDQSMDDLKDVLKRIHAQNLEYGQSGPFPHWTRSIPLDMASDMLLVSVHDLHSREHPGPIDISKPDPDVTGKNPVPQPPTWPGMAGNYLSDCHVVDDDRRISSVLSNLTAVLYNNGKPHSDEFPMYQCVLALSKQLDAAKETNVALTDDVRRRVIVAIHTVLRTRQTTSQTFKLNECLQYLRVLMLCSLPSTAKSPPNKTAEERAECTRRRLLADAIALAEDFLIRRLKSKEFKERAEWAKCFAMDRFFRDHQRFQFDQLAKQLSKKVVGALTDAVNDLPDGGPDYGDAWKGGRLAWLKKIEDERNIQAATPAADKDKTTAASSTTA